jgi:hypothetical protein
MAGRGMGAATKGGGAVEKGPRNSKVSETSKTTGPVFMADGGDVSPRKRMAMGMKEGGMAKMARGGDVKMARGGDVKMARGGMAKMARGGMAMGMKDGGKVKAGHHKMADGTIMKDSDHKKGKKAKKARG